MTTMMEHTFRCDRGLGGNTLSSDMVALPSSDDTICIHVQRDRLAEFRLCMIPETFAGETRSATDVPIFCFTIGQHGNTTCAIGVGNPHSVAAEDGYRHCYLPRNGDVKNLWILCDRATGWLALGHGSKPDIAKTLLASRLRAELRPSLAAAKHVVLSNWHETVAVKMSVSPASLAALHLPRDKFDLAGECIEIRGLTFVCALPAGGPSIAHPLHAIMCQVRAALATDPALSGNLALLPPDSYHMTVYDLTSAEKFKRAVEAHAADAAASASARAQLSRLRFPDGQLTPAEQLYTTTIAMHLEQAGILQACQAITPLPTTPPRLLLTRPFARARALSHPQSVPWTTFAMRVVGLDDQARSVELVPWDDSVCDAIDSWRAAVAAATASLGTHGFAPVAREVDTACGQGGRRWESGHYRCHMTVAYPNFPVGESEEAWAAFERIRREAAAAFRQLGPVVVGAPHLCHFDSMAAFRPITIAAGGAQAGVRLD